MGFNTSEGDVTKMITNFFDEYKNKIKEKKKTPTVRLSDVMRKIEEEGDYKEFIYNGMRCYIKRNPMLGILCGYVCIPRSHRFYGKTYDQIYEDKKGENLRVHGGITYTENYLLGKQPKIVEGDNVRYQEDGWYIGFDCGHAFDLCPRSAIILPEHLRNMTMQSEIYRDMQYVEKELKKLVDQLIEYEK